jgi:hypothetical protein
VTDGIVLSIGQNQKTDLDPPAKGKKEKKDKKTKKEKKSHQDRHLDFDPAEARYHHSSCSPAPPQRNKRLN